MPEVEERLTDRDVELVRLIGEMGSIQAAAKEIGLAYQTARNRLVWIYDVLGVPNAPAAVHAVLVEGRRGP